MSLTNKAASHSGSKLKKLDPKISVFKNIFQFNLLQISVWFTFKQLKVIYQENFFIFRSNILYALEYI